MKKALTRWFKLLRESLLAFIYPPRCLVCGSSLETGEAMLCETCWEKLVNKEVQFCRRCGSPLDGPHQICCPYEGRYSFSTVGVGVEFNKVAQRLIHALKYEGKRSLARPLGSVLAMQASTSTSLLATDLVIPVPLHPSRVRERGYNQSELIAEAVGQKLDRPVAKEVLIRKKRTKPQIKLDIKQRRENVAGAFQVKNPEVIVDKRVVLVDDVLTTGATLDACAQTLLEAGAKEVVALAVARAT